MLKCDGMASLGSMSVMFESVTDTLWLKRVQHDSAQVTTPFGRIMTDSPLLARLTALFDADPLMYVAQHALPPFSWPSGYRLLPHLPFSVASPHVYKHDGRSDEIGLLFGVAEEDLTLDSALVYAEHKLGVAFCAGAPLFRQARTRFHELNSDLAELRRQSGQDAGINDDTSAAQVVAELQQCSRAILLISADFYTAWNTR